MTITAKHWDKKFEQELHETWKQKKSYAFDQHNTKKLFSIDTPPPYVNSPIHIGHATTYSLMDMFARFRRMMGFNVLFPLGLDRNGLPIEVAAEKKFKVNPFDVSREQFISYCEKVLEESSMSSIDSYLKLGISFNSWKLGDEVGSVYYTDSEKYRAMTQKTFIDLWNAGLIYEAEYLTNYCPGCRTTIADSEIDRKDYETTLNYVRFTVKETKEHIIIATTRPELLCTAALIIFHPDDERYKFLQGKTAITPLFNLEIPIIAHTQADPAFGSGLVFMSKSAGDQDAVRFLREMNITPVSAVGIDGRMNEQGTFLKGLKTKEARQHVIDELTQHGFMEKQEKLVHSVPICERSKDMIEFVAMKEFYVKQVEFKEAMRELTREMHFYDEKSRQMLLDWIDSVSIDWPISRRRFYATEVPLWYCANTTCRHVIVPPKGRYYRPWKEAPPVKQCPRCHGTEFVGDERVLDTWFDSSSTPLAIMHWGTPFYEKHKPVTLRPQGKEIVRTWLYYTILKQWLLTKEIPFHDVWIHYHVVDDNGTKMSKSIGNIIDPHTIIERFGAEPFRLWCATEGNITTGDMRCSFERIEGNAKTLTKLWNVAKFVSLFDPVAKPKTLVATDRWIIHELNQLIVLSKEEFMRYNFNEPALKLRHFLWETFASHYIELVKSRAYNQDNTFSREEQESGVYTLHYCLETLLKVLAPVVPFITAKLYDEMYHKDIHQEAFPQAHHVEELAIKTNDLLELNAIIWKTKKDNNLPLNADVTSLEIPAMFKPLEKDLVAAHKVKAISYGDEIKIEI
ncbi:MAG: valine--tRNA ligase [Candidatus Aenigmarchaeota archaeon]|nr:valine--tRNA ligase [Candidatus Aenigmarchaeota archaeon]